MAQANTLPVMSREIDAVGPFVGERDRPLGEIEFGQRGAAPRVKNEEFAEAIQGIHVVEVGGEETMGVAIGPNLAAAEPVNTAQAEPFRSDVDVAVVDLRLLGNRRAADVTPDKLAAFQVDGVEVEVVRSKVGDVQMLSRGGGDLPECLESEVLNAPPFLVIKLARGERAVGRHSTKLVAEDQPGGYRQLSAQPVPP